ncbi:short-chain dehydrogenase/reductase SDR [Streptomyces davaonensis JCM 4913]|uniref:Short-chain dehydrogenase/reductase SDR n=1 Tax=Streptomyces davaonensis (strain DSM 101723 / JCM 4913 / KCC S-0913 / 768) TaxID=1214101 RepID=K4QW61_STRDJ|nr:SDR family NAD(P)-dependent oxidoreductase [Streptomyces davaonensis]CCK24624.1 short-chain dehydrogenase/reductase SDR [Streptomyces davaonensis JCM 4913]
MSKTWLITGSSRGLGRTLAESVLEAGHRLVATARRTESLSDLTETYGDRVRLVTLDVRDAAAAEGAVRAAVETFGRLDVVVNNAGYADMAAIEDMSERAFRDQIDANLFGVVHVTRAALPVLREQGAGHIIQISSVGGRVGVPGLGAYQAAKWAVGGFSEVLAQEVAPLGIKVTVAEPGGMRTAWAGSSMATPAVSAPYEPVVGAAIAQIRGADGRQPGDPARIARILLDITEMDHPPLRLLLGGDAVAVAQRMADRLAAQDAEWRHVSESV